MLDMSFEEKSVWGSLVAMVVCSFYYFSEVFGLYADGGAPDPYRAGVLGISLLIALIVIEIVYHSILAIGTRSTESDERDRWIETRASRNAYVALGVGTFGLVGHLVVGAHFGAPYLERLTDAFAIVNLLLLAMVIAEVVKYVSQIVYYRTGA
jgi:hypothetical protein